MKLNLTIGCHFAGFVPMSFLKTATSLKSLVLRLYFEEAVQLIYSKTFDRQLI